MMQKVEFHAMGCEMLVALDRDGAGAAAELERAPGWFETWEQHLSRFRPDSELSQANRRAGQEIPAGPVLLEALASALRLARQSDGLVNPTLLGALEAAGYDRDFEALRASPADETGPGQAHAPSPALSADPGETVRINRRRGRLWLAPGVRLDLGGTAKGWAADRAAGRLKRSGPALVDAGGDIAVSGPRRGGAPWPIGVADPFDPQERIDLIGLRRGGVATSGRYKRRWRKGGAWQHHIIDPRSGLPARTDVLSATVIAPSAQVAEMAAKVVLIGGSDYGLAWLGQHPRLAGLVVLENGEVIPSHNWRLYTLGEPEAEDERPGLPLPTGG